MALVTLAKIAGPVSSGIFAGYTWSLSDATISSILAAKDEATKARQWRVQYIQGFLVGRVDCVLKRLVMSLADRGTMHRYQFSIVAISSSNSRTRNPMVIHPRRHRYGHGNGFRLDVLASNKRCAFDQIAKPGWQLEGILHHPFDL